MKTRTRAKPTSDYAMTWDEVAEALSINQSTVGDTEKRAIAKVRKIFEERGIRLEDLL